MGWSLKWKEYKESKKKYIKKTDKVLDAAIYGMDDAKLQIKRIICQWINGDMKGYCFGFEGPPGTGKTSFAKKGLTKSLLIPDIFLVSTKHSRFRDLYKTFFTNNELALNWL